jgi:hypothetical protein
MDYKVVICSYKRQDTILKKSLAILEHYGIPKNKIFLFVSADEVEIYRRALPDYTVCLGALGLSANRNAVKDFFGEGDLLFFMDDDIKGYMEYAEDGSKKKLEDLDAFIQRGFQEATNRGASLWGLYPVANNKWLKKTISEGLVFCYGCSYGLINRKDITSDYCFKEDFERTLKFYLRDKIVIRLNWVAPIQTYCKGTGGLNESRTLEKERLGCRRLKELYGGLVCFDDKEKNGKYNIAFPRQLCKSVKLIR